MTENSYQESIDLVLSKVILSSSNIRSVSLVAATGALRRFRLRDDVNLLLNPQEMGDLIRTSRETAASFIKFTPKLGDLRHVQLDFENIQMLVFPMPDQNLLFVTLEKDESDVPRLVSFITRLLQNEGLVHAG